jgi:adenylate cyclase
MMPRMDEPGDASDLVRVVDAKMGASAGRASPMERIVALLSSRGGARGEAIDRDVAAMLRLIGLDPDDPLGAAAKAARAIEASSDTSVRRAEVPLVLQAYARGVGRIAAAEAQAIVNVVHAVTEEERPAVLERALDTTAEVGAIGFALLHRALLYDALRDLLAGGEDEVPLAVALVDLVGSTKYLKRAERAEVEELVDLLFEGAQTVTAGSAARVVKYVGDGVFFAGRDVTEVAEIALDLVGLLEAGAPLRARGGITVGILVERAGDLFGIPVNRAQILTKAARPGTVLGDEPAAALLPARLRARPRRVALPHSALGETTVVTVRRRR